MTKKSMTKRVVDVDMKAVPLSISAIGHPLTAAPKGSLIGVGVLRRGDEPLLALVLQGIDTMVSAMVTGDEFHALMQLLIEAGEECGAGATNAPQSQVLHEH